MKSLKLSMMKYILILLLLFVSTSVLSQSQNFTSHKRWVTEANYSEQFEDTTIIYIFSNAGDKLITLFNPTQFEAFEISEDPQKSVGLNGMVTHKYELKEGKTPVILELLFKDNSIIEIIITRPKQILTYHIIPAST